MLDRLLVRAEWISWISAVLWYCALGIAAFFALNGIYQVLRKPGELLVPFNQMLLKSPESTWQSYGSLFEKYSTNIIKPEFLAALAQVEGSGSPLASPNWTWNWSWNPFEIYRPASSAVGIFQMTDGNFAEARKYCIRDHRVVKDGPWYDFHSCWFNGLYARVLPSHSAEMTAAHLHRRVIEALAALRVKKARPAQQQNLAAVIHLCGFSRGKDFVVRKFRVTSGERCGTHSLEAYLAQIERMKKRFARLRRGT